MRRIAAALSGILTFATFAAPVQAQGVLVGSASGNGIQPWPSPGTQVTISDSGFSPNPLTIQVNSVVTFVNQGSVTHNASSPNGTSPTFDTGGLGPGQSTSFQFTIPGTFSYQSNTEGDKVITNNNGLIYTTYKLQGSIVVQNGPVTSTPPSAAAPAAPAAPGPCQFILGFATLHGLDPQDIGDCIDNQAFAPNGDA
jgi:plastocyanin